MNVLHVTTQESVFFKEQIRALEKKGINCDVIAASRKYWTERTVNPIEGIFHGHNNLWYLYSAMRFYPKVLADSITGEYDVVHVNNGMVAPFALCQPERPVVITFWGSDVFSDRLYGRLGQISNTCSKKSDANIVMSEEMGEQLDGESRVIPTGVDMNKFSPVERRAAKEEVGWDPDQKHVLFPYPPDRAVKRYPLAESVVTELQENYDREVNLQVVSDASHSEIPTYMNAADVLLMTSEREGSPNTVKEALACNLPIVSTDVGDTRERLQGVEPSEVCQSREELVDGVVSVLESGERCNGRANIQHLSWNEVSERIVEVYREVV